MPVSLMIAVLMAAGSSPVLDALLCEKGVLRSVQMETRCLSDSLPSVRTLAAGPLGNVLMIGEEGQLLLLDDGDLRALDASLPEGSWPEAIAADGGDWWVLIRQGRELRRLGRRGEGLGQLVLPEGSWREMALSASGMIWLADTGNGRILALSRGGRVLLEWDLERRLSGFSGGLDAWAPDDSGGLFLVEGDRLIHLNAAGNTVDRWDLPGEFRVGDMAVTAGRALLLSIDSPLSDLVSLPDGSLLGLLPRGSLLAITLSDSASP